MSKRARRAALALAVLALGAIVVWMLRVETADAGSGLRAPAQAASIDPPKFVAESQPAQGAALLVKGAGDEPAHSTPAATRLIVHVTWAADGSPATDIGLRFHGQSSGPAKRAPILGRSDAQGTWVLESPPEGKFTVRSDRDGTAIGIVKAGTTTEVTLAIAVATLLRGLVVSLDDRPVADAAIWLSMDGSNRDGTVITRSGADGRFTLRDVSGPRWINAYAEGLVPSDLVELERDLPPQMDLTLKLGGAGGEVHGLVVDPAGAPVQDAFVRIGPDGGWTRSQPELHLGLRALDLHTDAEGRFIAKDVPTGVVPVVARDAGLSPWNTAIKVDPGGSYELRIALKPGATLTGTARDDAGAPLAEVTVSIGESPAQFDYVSCRSDETGRYELHDPPLGAQTVSAKKEGLGGDSTKLAFLAGQTLAWDPQFSRGLQIVGRVRDESGASVERLRVMATHESPDNWYGFAMVAADGRFSVPNCENVAHRLEVSDGRGERPALAIARGVRPGSQDVVITIPADAHQAARLAGRLVEASGAVPEGVNLHLALVGSHHGFGAELEPVTGAFHYEGLTPGDYEFAIWRGSSSRLLAVPVTALRGGERRDLGTLTLAAPGSIMVHLALPAGAETNAYVALLGAEGEHHGDFKHIKDGPADWISGPLVPGDYKVALYPGSGGAETVFILPVTVPAHVEAGRETRLDLIAERGVAQNLHLQTERTPPPATTVIVTDAAGAEVCRRTVSWELKDDGNGQEDWVSFITRPGVCSLRVEVQSETLVERSLIVPGGVNIGPDCVIVVP
jgi:hypothetical protein